MLATLLAALLAGALGAAGACDDGVVLRNGVPRVTWVAVEPLGAERAALTLWLEDAEGDAVDVSISWSAGGASGELALAPGSAPLLGLPTELAIGSEDGQAHRVIWDLTGVPAGAVTLSLRADDRPHAGSEGDVFLVAGLDPRQGGGPLAATRE